MVAGWLYFPVAFCIHLQNFNIHVWTKQVTVPLKNNFNIRELSYAFQIHAIVSDLGVQCAL
jgi:hypothetical protein